MTLLSPMVSKKQLLCLHTGRTLLLLSSLSPSPPSAHLALEEGEEEEEEEEKG